MSKFHVGDKVRIHFPNNELQKQFYLEDEEFEDFAWRVLQTDFNAGQYDYTGPAYVVTDGQETWDVPEEALRPADIFAQAQEILDTYVPPFEDDDEGVREESECNPVKDDINHPAHYNRFPVEVINITEQLDFNRGNVVKYTTRAGFKPGEDEMKDLLKAQWYLNRAIEKLTKERENNG